jgi:lipid-A-disaccharide synthase
LCEDFVVPEFLQDRCTPDALAKACLVWLSSPERVDALQTRFQQLHLTLRHDTAKLSTDALEKVLAR